MPTNCSKNLLPAQIPLYRLKHPTAIIYRIRLPFLVCDRQSLPPWLEKLAALPCPSDRNGGTPLLAFTVEIGEAEGLDFHLQESSLAIWLQQLPQQLCAYQQVEQEEFPQIKANIFLLQYVYARCSSLLRLGHRECLIQPRNFSSDRWQWLTPEGKFQLVQPAERKVIRELLAVCDALDCSPFSPPPHWRQLGTALSIAFCHFERECRILGEIGQKNPALSQSRLGLIAITQLILGVLLENKLGIPAPTEL